jgi:PII-like signaling protein
MPANELVQRVRIYLSERDMSAGRPLYLATLEQLRREGATGATVLRGIAGFGAGHRVRTVGPVDLGQSPPIVIEWVDRAERVARVLPALDELLPTALITIEDLRVYRAALRSSGPFGERTVGEVMDRDISTVTMPLSLMQAVQLLLEREQPLLPVLDERGGIAGVILPDDLLRRAALPLPLPLLRALDPSERAALLATLPERPLSEIIGETRTIYIESPIPHAVSALVEWGLSGLPVADREGRVVGLFGVEQALNAALEAGEPDDGRVRNADPPTPVSLVMQRAVPTAPSPATLPELGPLLLAAPERFLVVVEGDRPIGTLTDAHLARQLQGPPRSEWLAALQASAPPPPTLFVTAPLGPTAATLAQAPAPTVRASATQNEATRLMLDQGHERLVVVDDDGRLVGLLARRALLRALAQASTG